MALDDGRHPDAGRLAEYADGTLDSAARAEVERHLADCADCRAVVMEAMAFTETEPAVEGATAAAVIPFRQRKWLTGAAAGLAVAAALMFAVRVARPEWLFGSGSDRPELQELIAAVANEPTRPVEGRLSGGFHYAPPPPVTRGGAREASPDLRIALAKIEKLARAADTPEHSAALGVAYLMTNRLDEAIEQLEHAVAQRPTSAPFQNDLAAAYVARATWDGRNEDWPKALAAADRAVAVDPGLLEALFNRALALGGLHLTSQATEAWADYRRRDTNSKWSTEARERASVPRSQGVRDSHQTVRDRVELLLLAGWAEAFLGGRDGATVTAAVREAADAAAALARDGGDCLADENARLIRAATEARRATDLAALARGHLAYAEARRALADGHVESASVAMSRAEVDFARVGSPYAWWGPIYRSMAARVNRDPEKALRELRAVPTALRECRAHLRGRYYWTRGVALYVLDRFVESRRDYELAVQAFQTAGELDNQSSTETLLAEVEFALGNRRRGWDYLIHALATTDAPRSAWRMLLYGGSFARADNLPETALRFQDAAVRLVETFNDRANRPDAYLQRARIESRLGDGRAALADLEQADRAIEAIDSPGFRERNAADANSIRAELLERVDPPQAIDRLDRALGYFRRTAQQIKIARLLMTRARTLREAGDFDGAHRDLHEAVAIMERGGTYLSLPLLERVQAVEDAHAATANLVAFELTDRRNYTEAFEVMERGRATALLASFPGRATAPIPTGAPSHLPSDVAVVYYATLADRVVVWVIAGGTVRHFDAALPAPTLTRLVDAVAADVQGPRSLAEIQERGSAVFAQLVAPALALLDSPRRIVIVPDGPLWRLPFAVAPDQGGQPLIARYVVTIAPSLAAFQLASVQLNEFSPDGVLAIGDGHPPAAGLPHLPQADREAAVVGALYPRSVVLPGPEATVQRVVSATQPVVHFAGHAVADPRTPSLSALWLAADPSTGSDGAMRAGDIAGTRFVGAKVVVLATCEGEAGRLAAGESPLSLAQMFFAAGVPSVVASLWPVTDDSADFMVQFHRALRQQHDPSLALQTAQVAALRRGGAVREWAAFVSIGGARFSGSSAKE